MKTQVTINTLSMKTVTTANAMGQLSQKAKRVTMVTLDRKLHEMLKMEKVGTYAIESVGVNIAQGQQKYDQVGDQTDWKKRERNWE